MSVLFVVWDPEGRASLETRFVVWDPEGSRKRWRLQTSWVRVPGHVLGVWRERDMMGVKAD